MCRGDTKERGLYDKFMECSCWKTRSCAKPEERCNCDANDNTWRVDEGYLSYKPDLPVSFFRAGDTGRWLCQVSSVFAYMKRN